MAADVRGAEGGAYLARAVETQDEAMSALPAHQVSLAAMAFLSHAQYASAHLSPVSVADVTQALEDLPPLPAVGREPDWRRVSD